MLGERLFEECDRTIVLRSLKVHARETCRRGQIVRIELARLCESALRLVEVVAIEQPESEPPPGRRVRAIQLDRAPYIADGIIRLPDDVQVEAILASRCADRSAGRSIDFFPSGMSCGGTIALARPGMGYQVRVNWLTGGVDIVPQKLL